MKMKNYNFLVLLFALNIAYTISSKCESEKDNALNLIGAWIPECDTFGYYAARQCHPSTGYCWCVRRDGTPITEKTREELACKCVREADIAINDGMVGSFAPQCQKNGLYNKKQCWASTGTCWCVHELTGKKGAHGSTHNPDLNCD